MHCRQVKGLLPAHLNKELSEGDRRALEAHIAACSSCRLRWRRLDHAERWLVRASQQSSLKCGPSVDFTASVMAAIVTHQQQPTHVQEGPSEVHTEQAIQTEEGQGHVPSPLGPWTGWNANLLGVWKTSPRLVLSGAVLAMLAAMIGVVALGVLLTQPALAAQALAGGTQVLAALMTGIYALVADLSVLANNQLLLAGVAAGYVVLAVLWVRLMRHQEHDEVVES